MVNVSNLIVSVTIRIQTLNKKQLANARGIAMMLALAKVFKS
jgi:Zn-dependent M28 family amino/carboxypeptidase